MEDAWVRGGLTSNGGLRPPEQLRAPLSSPDLDLKIGGGRSRRIRCAQPISAEEEEDEGAQLVF
jgi:hypothetical protein